MFNLFKKKKPQQVIERSDFVAVVSTIASLEYKNGSLTIRFKSGNYIHSISTEKSQFCALKREFMEKLNAGKI